MNLYLNIYDMDFIKYQLQNKNNIEFEFKLNIYDFDVLNQIKKRYFIIVNSR